MGRKKGRVPPSKDTKPVAPGMLGILQGRIGTQVTISFRADYVVDEEGLMVRQVGVLIPDPSGAPDAFCLMNVIGSEDPMNDKNLVGQKDNAVGLVSFTADVVALVGTAVLESEMPDIPGLSKEQDGQPTSPPQEATGTIITP